VEDRIALGQRGEDLAARFLAARGHQVLARRFRVRHGEVDLVTRSGRHLYFVEVKTRSVAARDDRFGGGLGALSWRKQRRMARVADIYIGRQRLDHLVPHLAWLTVEPAPDGARVHFVPDAFEAA
jgi:putative endonuclease